MRLPICGVTFCSGPFFTLKSPLRLELFVNWSCPCVKFILKFPSANSLGTVVMFLDIVEMVGCLGWPPGIIERFLADWVPMVNRLC